jgi:hypothetical protein
VLVNTFRQISCQLSILEGWSDKRENNRQRKRPSGATHLLARRRNGIQADEGEEDRRSGGTYTRDPEGRERL